MDYIVGFFTGIFAWPALELIALALAVIAGIFFIGNKHSDWNVSGFIAMAGIGYLLYVNYHPTTFSIYELGIFVAKYIGIGVIYALLNVFYQMYRKKQVISREKEEIAKNYYAVVSRNLNAQEDHLTGLTKIPDGEKVVETIVTFLKTGEPSFEVLSQKLESNFSDHIKRFVKRRVTEDREALEQQERESFLVQSKSLAMKAVVYSVIQHFNDVSYKHANFIEVVPAAHVPKWEQGDHMTYFQSFANYKPQDNSWVTVTVQKQKLYLNIIGSIIIYPILFVRQVVGDYLKMIADFLTDLVYTTVVKTAKHWFTNLVKI